ncbi:hypothetical protein [Tahibacter harae]|uniref:DUF302 domain-containing protein n=1 Tax=Tahibacter harae TaxID=2963937 RepID=A0ABT1QVN7_9GAMM|nr:hypothetical protein [Tahibacter harae]MCQ4166358.1 hypothetical protein [Tahibacter harae]
MKAYCGALLAALVTGCASTPAPVRPAAAATQSRDIFVIRSTDKSPDAVVEAIAAYAAAKKWPYLGADKVKQDQVTLVKICIPEVGQQLWPAGLHLSAMLPCGNFGVYRKDGRTEISLLHPRYMQLLYPDPAVEKASATAAPLLIQLLDTVAQ